MAEIGLPDNFWAGIMGCCPFRLLATSLLRAHLALGFRGLTSYSATAASPIAMKSLIPRAAPLLHPLRSLHPPCPAFLLFCYSAAADDHLHRRRPDAFQQSSPRRQHEEESRSVRVTVWWDFENCTIPNCVNVFRVAQRITSALRCSGIKGPVTINAFGDVAQLSRSTQEALTSTGVCLTHVPHSGKNSSDRFFMADLVYWVSHNPPPMHFFLISGDRDFANILHRLRMSNYNIILASTDSASGVLYSAATIMWPWNGLVRGDNVDVKHFNHPPDGLYGSWYGHYKGALDDPFLNMEQIAASQSEEYMESIAETKPRAIPKSVVNGIRQVLYLYPEGINMSELRAELKRNSVTMDKDFFGHKKFSQLLSSMPSIVKFIPHPSGESQPLVVGTHRRLGEPISKSTTEKVCTNGDKDRTPTEGIKSSSHSSIAPNPSPSPMPKEVDVTTAAGPASQSALTGSSDLEEKNAGNAVSTSTFKQDHDAVVREGFFRRFWKVFTGPNGDQSSNQSTVIVDSNHSESNPKEEKSAQKRNGFSEKGHPEKKYAQSGSGSSSSTSSHSSSLDAKKSDPKDKTTKQSGNNKDGPVTRLGFFSQVASWWKVLLYGAQEDVEVPDLEGPEKSVAVSARLSCKSEAHDLFSKSRFWDSLEAFLLDARGTDIISKSKTREDLVHKLRKESLSVLQGLKDANLHYLIDLLVSEKKWLEESSFQTFPFRLTLPAKRCTNSHSQGANGLSSLFSTRACQPDLQRIYEQDRQDQSTGKASDIVDAKQTQISTAQNLGKKKKPPSREEILSDCRKLILELLKENPDGFDMSIFRPAFIQRYGYVLDHQMLGYPKLASLLQIMPEVKVESSFILPAGKFNTNSKREKVVADQTFDHQSELNKQKALTLDNGDASNDEDSAWEELGPVSEISDGKDTKINQEMGKERGFSEASLSDEDLTGSEDDVPQYTSGSGQQQKAGRDGSYMLQVLDSFYSSKEGEDNQLQAVDGLVDCSKNSTQSSSQGKALSSAKLKTKTHRAYSFVSDSGSDDNDKLVKSILGSLRKAGNSRVHN